MFQSKQPKTKLLTVVGIAAAIGLVLSGCASNAEPAPANGEPINVASISGLTFFPEASQAAKAVFDEFNASGGLDGRPIEYTVLDDKTNPADSATAAKDALASGAVAMVGSASLLDCAVNHQTWEENDIISIQGTAVDLFCFTTPNIAAANTGPFFDEYASLYYGSEVLKFKNICALQVTDDPVAIATIMKVVDAWSANTGQKLSYVDNSLTRGQTSYASNLSMIKSQNCDALFINETGAAIAMMLAEATNQGVNLPVLTLTSAYAKEFAAAVGYSNDIYVPAEFSPFTDATDKSNDAWRTLMEKSGVPQTSFAQGGYLAAKYFIDILKTVEGDITRESVTAAAKAMTEGISSDGMTGNPWVFGDASRHMANTSVWPVMVKGGSQEWTSIGPWITGKEMGWEDSFLEIPAP